MPAAVPRPGDLILCHGTSPFARAIQLGQRLRFPRRQARWDHAALAISADLVAEAVSGGVRVSRLSGYPRRLVIPMGLDDAQGKEVCAYALGHVGEDYAWSEILGAGYFLLSGHRPFWHVSDECICSVFAANCLAAAGVSLPLPPYEMLPADLAALAYRSTHADHAHEGDVPLAQG